MAGLRAREEQAIPELVGATGGNQPPGSNGVAGSPAKKQEKGCGSKRREGQGWSQPAEEGEGKLESGPKSAAGWAGRAAGQNQPQTEGKVLSPTAL